MRRGVAAEGTDVRKGLQKILGGSEKGGNARLNADACDSLGFADEVVADPYHHTAVPGTGSPRNSAAVVDN